MRTVEQIQDNVNGLAEDFQNGLLTLSEYQRDLKALEREKKKLDKIEDHILMVKAKDGTKVIVGFATEKEKAHFDSAYHTRKALDLANAVYSYQIKRHW